MRTRETNKLIQRLARENNITYDQALEIVEAPFRFVVDMMQEGDPRDFDTFGEVRLIKFGVFKVKEGRRKYFEQYNKKNEKFNDNRK